MLSGFGCSKKLSKLVSIKLAKSILITKFRRGDLKKRNALPAFRCCGCLMLRVGFAPPLVAFSQPPVALGSYVHVSGTPGVDTLTGIGLQAAYGGTGNDSLGGRSTISADGAWKLAPILVGGSGNDNFYILDGSISFLGDAGDGYDQIIVSKDFWRDSRYAIVNQRDYLFYDEDTAFVVIDPHGYGDPANRIEGFRYGSKVLSFNRALKVYNKGRFFDGHTTYPELNASGRINFSVGGLDPYTMDLYIATAMYNNGLVV